MLRVYCVLSHHNHSHMNSDLFWHPEESCNTSMDHTKLQKIQRDKPGADQRINERHDNLSSATTKVAPTCSNTICSAYNFAAKHRAHPELTRHECRQGEANEESNDDETRHG